MPPFQSVSGYSYLSKYNNGPFKISKSKNTSVLTTMMSIYFQKEVGLLSNNILKSR